MNKETDNRRLDKRLHLPDLQIKVRPHGFKRTGDFIDCKSVDVSLNGLAFSSSDLMLKLLQKIDIRFSVGHKMIEGSAVICHMRRDKESVQYGVLYIDINPTIEEALCLDTLSSTLVKDLAIHMADNAVLGGHESEDDILLRKAQMFLFDAVDAFKKRTFELVKDNVNEYDKVHKLLAMFQVEPNILSVTVPTKNKDDENVKSRTISPVIIQSQVVFETDDGTTYESIIEILQDLSDTFQWVLSD